MFSLFLLIILNILLYHSICSWNVESNNKHIFVQNKFDSQWKCLAGKFVFSWFENHCFGYIWKKWFYFRRRVWQTADRHLSRHCIRKLYSCTIYIWSASEFRNLNKMWNLLSIQRRHLCHYNLTLFKVLRAVSQRTSERASEWKLHLQREEEKFKIIKFSKVWHSNWVTEILVQRCSPEKTGRKFFMCARGNVSFSMTSWINLSRVFLPSDSDYTPLHRLGHNLTLCNSF